MAEHEGPGPTLITSVQRAFRLLEAVSAHENGAPAKQLARETELPLATAYHLLRTLVHDGYLRKLGDGGFVLGDKVQTLHTTGRGQALLSRVRPTLAALRDELTSAAYLTFYEDGEIRVAEIVDSARAPRVDLWVGFEDAGHATALGKSVLRELDEDSRKDYLSRHRLADLTPRTITDAPELLRRLDSSPSRRPSRTWRSTPSARSASRCPCTAGTRSARSVCRCGRTGSPGSRRSGRGCSRPRTA